MRRSPSATHSPALPAATWADPKPLRAAEPDDALLTTGRGVDDDDVCILRAVGDDDSPTGDREIGGLAVCGDR